MKTKEEVRNYVWNKMEEENVTSFPKPVYGRIPNFISSDKACERVKDLYEYKISKVIFVAPDSPLRRIREMILEENKILIVALPHIKDIVEIDERINIKEASTIKGFSKYGKPLKSKIDLIIEGSVAVDLKGNRIGKGKGYGDREYEILKERGFLREGIKIVTIVHEFQIFKDFSYLMNEKDIKVNYIITDKRIIRVS